jgi:rubrerythrin
MPPTREQILGELNRCLTGLAHSTARYLVESNPYIGDGDKDAMNLVKESASAETAQLDKLVRLIESMEGVAQPGLCDPSLAELNYLSFPRLLEILEAAKEKEIGLYERRIEAVDGQGFDRAKEFFEATLAVHREHLAKIRHLLKVKYSRGEEKSAA